MRRGGSFKKILHTIPWHAGDRSAPDSKNDDHIHNIKTGQDGSDNSADTTGFHVIERFHRVRLRIGIVELHSFTAQYEGNNSARSANNSITPAGGAGNNTEHKHGSCIRKINLTTHHRVL